MKNGENDRQDAGDRNTPDPLRERDSERRQPILDDFDSEESYEESDRDTDYASVYTEDILDDDEVEELIQNSSTEWKQDGEKDYPVTANTPSDQFSKGARSAESSRSPGEHERENDDEWRPDTADDFDGQTSPRWTGTDPRDDFKDDFDYDDDDDGSELWDDDDYENEGKATWPLGLIAVAVIALLLLGAGGYGVVQQRTAMESEIRELQSALATAASPEDVATSRDEVTKMRSRYEELRITLNSLNLENRRLRDTVNGLESQLAAQQEIAKTVSKASKPASAKPAPEPAAPKPAAPKPVAPKPAAPKSTAPATATPTAPASAATQAIAATGWFVNFGSYSKRATAESWAKRLQPATGTVIVATGDKAGTTFYRVRIVNLPNRDQAEKVAKELEKSYGLSRLWVGQQ